jgi:uncharacterized membrane protein YhaH (DUF805 family)
VKSLTRLEYLGKMIQVLGGALLTVVGVYAIDNVFTMLLGSLIWLGLIAYSVVLAARRLRDIAQGYSVWLSLLVLVVANALTAGVAGLFLFVLPSKTFVKKD